MSQAIQDAVVTSQALQRMTPEQCKSVATLLGSGKPLRVFIAFELPDTYVAFLMGDPDHQIYGGIGPDGLCST